MSEGGRSTAGGANQTAASTLGTLSRSPFALGAALIVGGVAEVVGTRFPPGEYEPPSRRGHKLCLHRSAPRRRTWSVGGRVLDGTAWTGDVGVVPAGRAFMFAVRETSEALSVLLEGRFVCRVAEEAGADPARFEVLETLCARDSRLQRLMLSFLPEIETGSLGGELYAQALTQALAVHLLREHSSLGEKGKREVAREPTGRLSRAALAKATDFVGDNLSADLSLEEIASEVNLSPPLLQAVQGGHGPQPVPVRDPRARREGQGAAREHRALHRGGSRGGRLRPLRASRPPLRPADGHHPFPLPWRVAPLASVDPARIAALGGPGKLDKNVRKVGLNVEVAAAPLPHTLPQRNP